MNINEYLGYRIDAREQFKTDLLDKNKKSSFKWHGSMIKIIDTFPFFHQPYTEILEYFEGLGRTDDYVGFLKYTSHRFNTFLKYHNIIADLSQEWSFDELWSFKCLLQRLRVHYKNNPVQLYRFLRLSQTINSSLIKTAPSVPSKYLKKIEYTTDIQNIHNELRGKEHFWYANFARQNTIYNHRHTQAIVLRGVPSDVTQNPVSIFENHESNITDVGSQFKKIIGFTEQFAARNNLGLGRVALVRLKPKKMVYRHTDEEIGLRNRNRYHFCLDENGKSLLISGTESMWIKGGELLFFDNKVPHKTYNDSNEWRINLIFDAFPLS